MWFLVSLLVGIAHAEPFRIGVVTEPGARAKSLEFIQQVSLLEPFRQLIAQGALEITAQPVVIADLGCRGGAYNIARLAQCELERTNSACQGKDLCPVFTAVPNIGAGNELKPISSGTFPWTTMLHEVVHSFGFTDEYAYPTVDAPTYCGYGPWQNGHTDDRPNRYRNARDAERDCVRRIAWCQQAIDSGTPVVQRRADGSYMIGSPAPVGGCPSAAVGVYLGGSCQNLNPQSTWRPTFCPSIQGYPSIGESNCQVERRQAIIRTIPDLIPGFHQRAIFDAIVRRKNLRGLRFQPTPMPAVPRGYRFGIPEVDRLAHPEGPLPDACLAAEVETAVATLEASTRAIQRPVTLGCSDR